ncbi:MAG: hypothetical protein KF810_02510 [Rhizobiaceae bacterium]|nr:hypothetical protein [Rhizobiaceae bacterium]
MTFRLTPALSIILLAGCTSSEPQNVSYAPVAAQPTQMQQAPLPPPSMPTVTSEPASGTVPLAPASALMTAAPAETSLPVSPEAPAANTPTVPASDADIAAGVPEGATNCSTVDGVTLCDAPFDPVVDATQNTN